ncbi:helix-turn-helix domain-containing protein [Dellaglioa sp. L3N]
MNRGLILGNKIKEARKNKGVTQQELAEKLNINPQYISKWENGKMDFEIPITKESCNYLEIDFDNLLDNRRMHIEKSEKLIYFGENVLELVNEKLPKEFYKKYRLINKEQYLLFPTVSCQYLLDEIDVILKKELSNFDFEKNQTFVKSMLGRTRTKINSKAVKNIREILREYIEENKINDELAKSDILYNTVKSFITFWIWVNQMVTYLSNDLTENGLKLITEPISDEEFFANKDYFPKEPGTFLYRILISRGYKSLIDYNVIETDEIKKLYEYHLNDQRINEYYQIAKEKFNYINKVKFY